MKKPLSFGFVEIEQTKVVFLSRKPAGNNRLRYDAIARAGILTASALAFYGLRIRLTPTFDKEP